MIQRKQTIFLLIAAISSIVCLCMPIGTFRPVNLGVDSHIYNLWIQNGNGALDYGSCPLFFILLLNAVISVYTIFLYKKRKLQMKLCRYNNVLVLIWYAVYAAIVMTAKSDLLSDFRIGFAAVLPLVSLILTVMARRGVKADEALIRAAERIR